MRIGEIYKSKESHRIIQIDSYAMHVDSLDISTSIVVFTRIQEIDGRHVTNPMLNGYGTKDEIEKEYDLILSAEDIMSCEGYDDIIELIAYKEVCRIIKGNRR